MMLEGGCSCGAIRYKLTNSPLIVHACHCRDCQRITGGPHVINIWIERKFVEATGAEPKSFVLKGGSGKKHEVFFCDDVRHLRMEPLQHRAGRLPVRARRHPRHARSGDARCPHLHAQQAAVGSAS